MSFSVEEALREIDAIESIIRPYEYYTTDAANALRMLTTMKNLLREMNKENLEKALDLIKSLEDLGSMYRGYEPVEEASIHLSRLRNILKKYKDDKRMN